MPLPATVSGPVRRAVGRRARLGDRWVHHGDRRGSDAQLLDQEPLDGTGHRQEAARAPQQQRRSAASRLPNQPVESSWAMVSTGPVGRSARSSSTVGRVAPFTTVMSAVPVAGPMARGEHRSGADRPRRRRRAAAPFERPLGGAAVQAGDRGGGDARNSSASGPAGRARPRAERRRFGRPLAQQAQEVDRAARSAPRRGRGTARSAFGCPPAGLAPGRSATGRVGTAQVLAPAESSRGRAGSVLDSSPGSDAPSSAGTSADLRFLNFDANGILESGA